MTTRLEKDTYCYVVSERPIEYGNQALTIIRIPSENVQAALSLRTQIKAAMGEKQTKLKIDLRKLVGLDEALQEKIEMKGNTVRAGQIAEIAPPSDKPPFPIGVVNALPS